MDAPKSLRAWRLFVLGTLTMLPAVCIDMYLPAFPLVAKDLGVGVDDIGLTLTTFMIGIGLGQVIYGPLSDRYGRKIPLIVGMLIFIAATVFCAFATSLPVLIFWRFIQALGASAGIVIARAMVRDFYSGVAMAKVMTILGMVFALGPAFAPSIGALILLGGNWHTIFFVLIFLGIVVLFMVISLPESHPQPLRNSNGVLQAMVAYREILRNRTFVFGAVILCADFGAFFSYVSTSSDVLMGEYGLSASSYAIVFGLISLALVVGSQINIRALPKRGINTMLKVFTTIQIVGSLLVFIALIVNAPLWLVLIILTFVTGSTSSVVGNTITMAMSPFSHLAGSAAALAGLFQMGMAGVVAAVLALLPFTMSLQMVVIMIILLAVAAILVRSKAMPQLES